MKRFIKRKIDINIEKENEKYITKKILKPLVYKPSDYNISDKYTGRGVKIAVIDSGCPKHKDIEVEGEKLSFCGSDLNEYDKIGHSTMVSGIIMAKNKNAVKGLATRSQVHFAKVINSQGKCNFNSLIAAILWAVVREVDIITIALGSQYDYSVLHDAVKKAFVNKICIFAAAGKIKDEKTEIDFPAKYKEVFSVCSSYGRQKNNEILEQKVDLVLPNTKRYTTYLDNSYIKTSGSSISTAIVTALASLIIEKNKSCPTFNGSPLKIYSEIKKIMNNC